MVTLTLIDIRYLIPDLNIYLRTKLENNKHIVIPNNLRSDNDVFEKTFSAKNNPLLTYEYFTNDIKIDIPLNSTPNPENPLSFGQDETSGTISFLDIGVKKSDIFSIAIEGNSSNDQGLSNEVFYFLQPSKDASDSLSFTILDYYDLPEMSLIVPSMNKDDFSGITVIVGNQL